MPEGIEVGHQFDEAFLAVLVDLLDFLRSQWGCILPYGLMILKGEGMLHIKLQFIVAQSCDQIDQCEQFRHRGNLAPADIEHESAPVQPRLVFDINTCYFSILCLFD